MVETQKEVVEEDMDLPPGPLEVEEVKPKIEEPKVEEIKVVEETKDEPLPFTNEDDSDETP